MVSMKEIASLCHVSVATVSKALNGHSDISPETKRLIREKADELGYFPNPAARALKTHSTYNIGVVFYDDSKTGLTHEFFASVLQAVRETAEKRGYDVTFISHFVGGKRLSYAEHSSYRNVDGVVIVCADFTDPELSGLVASGIPVVAIDHIYENCSSVMSDNVKGMKELVELIYHNGHRHIAYLHGATSTVTEARLSSFYRTCTGLGLHVPEDFVIECAYHDTETANLFTRQLIARENAPTCILYPDDITAISGMSVLRSLGIRVPLDVSVIGYDGILIGQTLEPKLTTFRQDMETMGSCAANKLIDQIEQPRTTVKEVVMVSGYVQRGATLADISGRLTREQKGA